MASIEAGNKSREAIKAEFLLAFPESAGKSTFSVFFADVVRPFGSSSVSRDIRIETDPNGCVGLDRQRAQSLKVAIAKGLLKELSGIERNVYPKKDVGSLHKLLYRFGISSSSADW
jgi:hypothetical protein